MNTYSRPGNTGQMRETLVDHPTISSRLSAEAAKRKYHISALSQYVHDKKLQAALAQKWHNTQKSSKLQLKTVFSNHAHHSHGSRKTGCASSVNVKCCSSQKQSCQKQSSKLPKDYTSGKEKSAADIGKCDKQEGEPAAKKRKTSEENNSELEKDKCDKHKEESCAMKIKVSEEQSAELVKDKCDKQKRKDAVKRKITEAKNDGEPKKAKCDKQEGETGAKRQKHIHKSSFKLELNNPFGFNKLFQNIEKFVVMKHFFIVYLCL